jgi:hypothetical protein
MKKLLLIPATLLIVGCTNNSNIDIDKNIENTDVGMKLLKQYNISPIKLHSFKNGFVFVEKLTDGSIHLSKLNKNYQKIQSKKIDMVIDPREVKIYKDKIYLLAYDQTPQKTVVLEFDENLNLKNKTYFGKKFDSPVDFIVDSNGFKIVANHYSKNNGTDIVVWTNNNSFTFSTQYAEEANFIRPFKDGYLIVGNISDNTQNVLIFYVDKNFKTKWVRDFDFGLEEEVVSIKTKGNSILLGINSENYTGMTQFYNIELDENGKILNKTKEFEIKNYPLKFQG